LEKEGLVNGQLLSKGFGKGPFDEEGFFLPMVFHELLGREASQPLQWLVKGQWQAGHAGAGEGSGFHVLVLGSDEDGPWSWWCHW